MLHPLIEHSEDLRQLRADGYKISIKNGYLVVDHIPFVNSESEIVYGSLISELSAQGNVSTRPNGHTVFSTHIPYDTKGNQLKYLILDQNSSLVSDYTVVCQFSNTPGREPDNYYEKITHYIDLIAPHAQAIDPGVTAKVNNPADSSTHDVFRYIDSNTSRANTGKYSALLAPQKIAIVGLGGTGSYILDLVAKTPVREIHLYDEDIFSNHNAFRSPGAASLDDLSQEMTKVEYAYSQYTAMRKAIYPHETTISSENIAELYDFNYVFLCIDNAMTRSVIARFLADNRIPFVDVGITVETGELGLIGSTRVTAVYPNEADSALQSLPIKDGAEALYSSNIQVADVNMLNAAQAVIEWKRWSGFYFKSTNQFELMTVTDSGMSVIR